MKMRLCWSVAVGLTLTGAAFGQTLNQSSGPWDLEQSGMTAGLRGIHAVGGGVAWASGTHGTVLRTEDDGYEWQSCAIPPGAAQLDFRGIWAWDSDTAVVMSSGPGDQSRLYRTTDGCAHWTLLSVNPDKDGFWDAIAFSDRARGFLLGDPVNGRFVLLFTLDGGRTWGRVHTSDLDTGPAKIGAFAASNSALSLGYEGLPMFGTSGPGGPWLYVPDSVCTSLTAHDDPAACFNGGLRFKKEKLPMAGDSPSSGIFSIAFDPAGGTDRVMAVGGDYLKPNDAAGTAAATTPLVPAPQEFAASQPPHGYRSAVGWDVKAKAWIAAGTNGSDISYDNGKTWQALDNGNWNALSLPWVVGPDGRIGKLDPEKIQGASTKQGGLKGRGSRPDSPKR